MQWVNSITWNGTGYVVVTIDKSGTIENVPVSTLADLEFSNENTRKTYVTTDFSTWSTISVETFLPALEYPSASKHGQKLYEFDANGVVYQIPAIVLMKSLFHPLRGLAHQLFRPQSLDNILVSTDRDGKSVDFFCTKQHKLKIKSSNTTSGTHAALHWMYCFPSARRMWDSALENARQGTLGLQLPIGTVEMFLSAFNVGGKLVVSKLSLVSVSTTETPFDFSSSQGLPTKFQFQSNNINKAPKKLTNIPSRKGIWSLSDDEWAVVEPILTKSKKQKHCLRTIVNCLLEKFGQGIAWRKLTVGIVNRPAIIWQYQQMLKDGRWEKMVKTLSQLRATSK
ncbi:transposase [Crenobacter sp. SG2303]|uniref:Transposase n=1 Tax=Crenobacter oryzisoli TaxID=3056844 RepID=A0ABT7XNQ2_9NEIS|nr:transposase [Crenobacter sp. SG2303]MDN0075420.1 transposase [Crenobacter sp. SG2303]